MNKQFPNINIANDNKKIYFPIDKNDIFTNDYSNLITDMTVGVYWRSNDELSQEIKDNDSTIAKLVKKIETLSDRKI